MKKILASKCRKGILILIIVLFLTAIVYFFNFTPLGIALTINMRGFSKVHNSIYVDDSMINSKETIQIIDDAEERVKKFFGEIKSNPKIIVTNDEKMLKRLGWTGSPAFTKTYVFNGAYSFCIISPDGLDTDVTAHELTHAEVHKRLYDGKIFSAQLVPVWFDEGVATQNDYRVKYGYEKWQELTDNGENIIDFNTIKDSENFYASDNDTRFYNYVISKHEVEIWLVNHSIEDLIDLLDDVNNGDDFDDIYYKIN